MTSSAPSSCRKSIRSLIVLIVVCCAVEGMLQLAARIGVGGPRLRVLAYEYGGFWAGLLQSWTPNYPAQPYAMFVTCGFLHGGLLHLIVNMITLWSLGRAVLDRVGERGFILLYVASLLGGAAGFALIGTTLAPMVGASGALFGLAGGLLAWGYTDRFSFQEALWPIAQAVCLLIAINVVMWWALNGQLAWETHLGGFLAGWFVATLIDPRPRAPEGEA